MKTRSASFAVTIIILLSSGFLLMSCAGTGKKLEVYRLSDDYVYNKLLLLRRVSARGNLLLKILDEDHVVLYDVEKKTVTRVDQNIWYRSTEKVSVCSGSAGTSDETEKSYNTYAKYALSVTRSPGESKLAIYTAGGPKVPGFSIIPGLGGGYHYYGNRYIEIRSNDAKKSALFEPVLVDEFFNVGICWSSDEDIVVVYDFYSFGFSVLDLNPEQHVIVEPEISEPKSVASDLSRFTGVMRDHGVDENGDGLYDKIAVEIETETTTPGTYTIRADLLSRNGHSYIEVIEAELRGGKEITTLLFDTKPLYEAGDDGSFEYRLLALDYLHSISLDQREDVGRTSEYKLSQFKRPNIAYTGKNKVTPVDKNRNGKFEGLEIRVGVDALYPADYHFQGDLYDEFSDVTGEGLVEFGSGSVRLVKGPGELVFFFSGKSIIEHGKSGRFRLRFVVIAPPGQRGPFSEVLLTTDSFDIDQFEAVDQKRRPNRNDRD